MKTRTTGTDPDDGRTGDSSPGRGDDSSGGDDAGYVHTPGGVADSSDGGTPDQADDAGYVHTPDRSDESADGSLTDDDRDDPTGEDDLGVKGWVLVGVVVTATIVIPGLIYLFPAAPGEAGLPFLIAMLVLPFLPAVLLGLTAVWSLTAGE
ncbi:MAG: hypothetical protein ABEI99_12400 [Halobaculum sp.]